MNKFKFGDRVHVGYPYWRNVDDVGVILHHSEDGVNNVQFARGAFSAQVPDEFLTLATDWVKCSERMPEEGQSVTVYDGDSMWIDITYDFGDGLCFYYDDDGRATHWQPLPTPPQD